MALEEASSETWLIGAFAAEEEGIFFSTAECDAKELKSFSPPLLIPKPRVKKMGRSFVVKAIEDFLSEAPAGIECFGISMFGLIDIEKSTVVEVPRKNWPKKPLNFETVIQRTYGTNCSVVVQNDCTARAMGEYHELHQNGDPALSEFVYVYVGKGVGVGILNNGTPRPGRIHPEMAHIRPIKHPTDPYPGDCKSHKVCIDGLSGREAVLSRAGGLADDFDLSALAGDDLAWEYEAFYLAQLLSIIVMSIAPTKIVLGGSVIQPHLIDKIRNCMDEDFIEGFPFYSAMQSRDFLMSAKLGDEASILGAMQLARIRSVLERKFRAAQKRAPEATLQRPNNAYLGAEIIWVDFGDHQGASDRGRK